MSSIKYRAEIDGLRVIAVISVIIYHLNENWLPGGFLGVDIFFVITIDFFHSREYRKNELTS